MPTEKYTFRKDVRGDGRGTPISYKPVTALTDLVSGEFVGWDTDDPGLKRFVRDEAGSERYVGISRDSQAGLAKLGNQPPLADFVGASGLVSVFSTGVHLLLGTAAETYVHGTTVYMSGTNTQKITNVAGGGVAIGRAFLPDGSSKIGAVEVPVLIDGFTKFSGGPTA